MPFLVEFVWTCPWLYDILSMETKNYHFEYRLAKATLKWLVSIKLLTICEAHEIDKLNRTSFEVPDDVSPNWWDA